MKQKIAFAKSLAPIAQDYIAKIMGALRKLEFTMMRGKKMARYKIEYAEPETGVMKTIETEQADCGDITSRQWAEDLAYSLADKGYYKVTLV